MEAKKIFLIAFMVVCWAGVSFAQDEAPSDPVVVEEADEAADEAVETEDAEAEEADGEEGAE